MMRKNDRPIRNLRTITPLVLIVAACLVTGTLYAQEERKQTRKGNKAYEQEDYDKANEHYQKALDDNAGFTKAHNNLASSYYRQEDFKKAAEHFEKATLNETEKANLAEYYYNLGNSYLQANELDKSIKAYKESLRLDPSDMQAKHNLSIANKKKQQQQQNQDQQQDQEGDKDQQEQQDQQDQQQEGQEQQEQEQQPQPQNQMKREDAERLLKLIEQNEKELLKKLEEEKSKQQKRDADKNW